MAGDALSMALWGKYVLILHVDIGSWFLWCKTDFCRCDWRFYARSLFSSPSRVTDATLPRDKDGDPYRPFPCPIRGLEDQIMDKISCAVMHNLALDNKVSGTHWRSTIRSFFLCAYFSLVRPTIFSEDTKTYQLCVFERNRDACGVGGMRATVAWASATWNRFPKMGVWYVWFPHRCSG